MNKGEMKNELIKQAQKGCEGAAFSIGDYFYIIRNISADRDSFIADIRHVAELLDMGEAKAFIHTHLNCSAEMSETDLEVKKLWPNMDWIIYRIDDGKITDKKVFV